MGARLSSVKLSPVGFVPADFPTSRQSSTAPGGIQLSASGFFQYLCPAANKGTSYHRFILRRWLFCYFHRSTYHRSVILEGPCLTLFPTIAKLHPHLISYDLDPIWQVQSLPVANAVCYPIR